MTPSPSEEEAELRRHEEIRAQDRDKQSPVWDMSQERAFLETLLNQRFNFFLVFFSLVMAGSVNAKSQTNFRLILSLGLIVCVLLASALRRSQEKLDLVLSDLKLDPSHPTTLVDKASNQDGSRRRLVGIWIPAICCSALAVATVAAWLGWLQSAPSLPPTLTR